jgi:hypothetical protein
MDRAREHVSKRAFITYLSVPTQSNQLVEAELDWTVVGEGNRRILGGRLCFNFSAFSVSLSTRVYR